MKYREMAVLTTVLVALSWAATPAVALKGGANVGGVGVGANVGSNSNGGIGAHVGVGTNGSGSHNVGNVNANIGGSNGSNVNGKANVGGNNGATATANANLGGSDGTNAHANVGLGGDNGTDADVTVGTGGTNGTKARVLVNNGGTNGTTADVNATIGDLANPTGAGSGTVLGNVPTTVGGILGGTSAQPSEDPNSPTPGVNANAEPNSTPSTRNRDSQLIGNLSGLTPTQLRDALNDLDPSDVRKIKKSCVQMMAGGGSRNAMAVCKVIASL